LLPVDLAQQLLPETFEHALNHLLEHEIDLSGFDARFCNDETGATAYPPAMLWKVVLFAYSRGVFGNLRYNKGLDRFTLCGKGNSMHSGSPSAWSTTSRSSRIGDVSPARCAPRFTRSPTRAREMRVQAQAEAIAPEPEPWPPTLALRVMPRRCNCSSVCVFSRVRVRTWKMAGMSAAATSRYCGGGASTGLIARPNVQANRRAALTTTEGENTCPPVRLCAWLSGANIRN